MSPQLAPPRCARQIKRVEDTRPPGWRLTPGFAVSIYEEGSEGKDLGGPVEFRSSLELSRRLPGGYIFSDSFGQTSWKPETS